MNVPTLIQVGLGPWGQDWARQILPRTSEAKVVGRVDSNPARLEEAGAVSGVPGFTSLAEALDSTQADAVLATVRIEAHYAIAREALLAGKHVLLEKPFTVDLDQAVELNEIAAARGLTLCVAQNYRFWPAVATVSRLLAEGTIGRILNTRVSFRRDHGSYEPALAAPLGSATGSVLYQISVHHFDLVRKLLGEITDVAAVRWARGNLPGRLTAFSATLTLDDGSLVEYSTNQVSHAAQTPWSGSWEIEGELGVISWEGNATAERDDARVCVALRSGEAVDVPVQDIAFADRFGVIHEFVQAIGRKGASEISGGQNIGTLAAIDMTNRSLEPGVMGVPARLP